MTAWTVADSKRVYNISNWGDGYFSINESGHITVTPIAGGPALDLFELATEAQAQGLSLPVLLRFVDILHDRVDRLSHAFQQAKIRDAYQGDYTAVYPIKVNQQRCVVDAIVNHGGERVGLEAGSKPELLIALAMSQRNGVVVCNGYKDREYIRLALIGRHLGIRVYIVVDKPSELALIIEESKKLGVQPFLGVRLRLSSLGAGKWQNTGGEKSKFGLAAADLLELLEHLRTAQMLSCLSMLHFHLGSQIANIADVRCGLREAASYYAELHRLGCNINVVDVGGGLGVDYEGTRSRSFCSLNYSVQEYANNVVHAFNEVCQENSLPHPHLMTESGRAMTAHHAVLVTNVIDVEHSPSTYHYAPPGEESHALIKDLWRYYTELEQHSPVEVYHEAVLALAEIRSLFSHGVVGLEERAVAEQLYFTLCHRIRPRLSAGVRAHRALLDELNEKLADKYLLNFSLFQSLPDVWAIEQVFPITPLHRLEQQPTRRGVVGDLTCDSDGRVDHYADENGIESTLPLHLFSPDENYLLGLFLVGAYQETLGDIHNLFGDTDSVNVVMEGGSCRFVSAQRGDTVDDVLNAVKIDDKVLMQHYRRKIDKSTLNHDQRRLYMNELEAGLRGYTYLEE